MLASHSYMPPSEIFIEVNVKDDAFSSIIWPLLFSVFESEKEGKNIYFLNL